MKFVCSLLLCLFCAVASADGTLNQVESQLDHKDALPDLDVCTLVLVYVNPAREGETLKVDLIGDDARLGGAHLIKSSGFVTVTNGIAVFNITFIATENALLQDWHGHNLAGYAGSGQVKDIAGDTVETGSWSVPHVEQGGDD